MKSKTSTEYSYVTSIGMRLVYNNPASYYLEGMRKDAYKNLFELSDDEMSDEEFMESYLKDLVGRYLFFDGEYYGPIRDASLDAPEYPHIKTDDKLPEEMEGQNIKIYEKKSVTTTTYPPFYHKAKKGQSLYVKKNGVIGNEPDVYVKTGGTIMKLY